MNKNNINSSYSAAFTAGALLYQEMNSVLHLLMQPNGEELMKDEIEKDVNAAKKIAIKEGREQGIAEGRAEGRELELV